MPQAVSSLHTFLVLVIALVVAGAADGLTATPTPTITPTPTGVGALGDKTTAVQVFNLASGAPLAGAAFETSGSRLSQRVAGESDGSGAFAFTIDLRDSDTVLVVVGAPGFAERRRGYRGLDLWYNQAVVRVGLVPEGLCPGDCDGDQAIGVAELIVAVGFALGDGTSLGCPLADQDGDGRVAVNDIVSSVQRALDGCAGAL